MPGMATRVLLVASLAVLVGSCVPPTRDFDAAQIKAVTDFDELMWVQATVADDRFKMAKNADPNALSDSELGAFIDMGQRLQATARRIPELGEQGKNASFRELAAELASRAAVVEREARAKNGPAAVKAVLAVKDTCQKCHAEFK